MAEGRDIPIAEQEKKPSKRPPWWKRLWRWTEFGKKSGWNWLELLSALAIPVVLTVAGFWFAAQQEAREDKRAELERELAEQRAQDEALQKYLDQMSTLLLEKDLRSSTEDNATEDSKEARSLARARTLTVLARLDPSRKSQVLQFLEEAGLIQDVHARVRGVSDGGALVNPDPIIVLNEANLRDADLFWYMRGASLSFADLRGAGWPSRTTNATLADANLRGADLSGADLSGADLSGADLFSATGWTEEQLSKAESLKGATMPDGQILKSVDNPDRPTFEEWLKDKEGGGENGENNGPS